MGDTRIIDYAGNVEAIAPLVASDPSIAQDANGNIAVAARYNDGRVLTSYRSATGIWTALQSTAFIFQGVPSVAITPNGDIWFADRDISNRLGLLRYASGEVASNYVYQGGEFETDPVIAACPDGSVYMVGKSAYNSLWSIHYVPGGAQPIFVSGGGVIQGKPAVACGSDNAAYIAGRDSFSSVWVARVSADTWTDWWNGGAVAFTDPKIVALGGSLAIVILDAGGAVFRSAFTEGAGNGWQAWSNVGGILGDVAPVGVGGELYFLGRDASAHLWWWKQTGDTWTHIGLQDVAGELAGNN